MTNRFLPFLMFPGVAACMGGILLLTPLLPTARAQQGAAAPPPLDPAAVLAALKDLKTKQTGIITKERAGVLASINAAINDPGRAYEQAVMAVEIQGEGNEGSRAVDWRKRNTALLRDRNFLEALRLQLNYIALTWQHSAGAKVKDQIPALLDYTAQVNNAGDTVAALDIAKKPLSASVFVAYFQLGPFLTQLGDWEDHPFNVEGIYQKTILPSMRADKDPRVLDYWSRRIQAEASNAKFASNGLAANKTNNVRLPQLFWSRAEDEFAIGMTSQAVADMMALIKGHPDHPDFDRWVERVTNIVSPPKGEVTVSPGTTP